MGKGGPGGRRVSGDEAWAWAGRPSGFFWAQEGGAWRGGLWWVGRTAWAWECLVGHFILSLPPYAGA